MIAAILMTAVLVNASDYSFLVPLREARVAAHQAIVARSAPTPEGYRVLVPFALEVPIRVLAGTIPYDKALGRVYAVFHFAALAALLAVLVYESSFWFSIEQALVGALLVGSTIRIALRQGEYLDLSSIPLSSVFAPHSLLEPVFVAGTIVLALRDHHRWIAALMVVASLNSEIAVGLPLIYCAVRGVSPSSLKTTIGYLAIWVVVWALLGSIVGSGQSSTTIGQLWRENLSHLPTTLINLALFVGPLWFLAGRGVSRAPDVARRLAWLIPVYLTAIGVCGLWWDVRLLMPLYPLLIPLILAALFSPRLPSNVPVIATSPCSRGVEPKLTEENGLWCGIGDMTKVLPR
jgi:hypothetical protein